ncbi:zeta toxin family protein [Lactiplantibacillus plantarum]
MDELADYTDYQFAVRLQTEIEQLTKNKQAQASPKAYLLGGQPGAGKIRVAPTYKGTRS